MNAFLIKLYFFILWLFAPDTPQCNGANILAVLPSVWKSHYLFSYHILCQLVEQNNHSITLISPYDTEKEDEKHLGQKVKEIKVDGLLENWIEMGLSFDIEEMHYKSVMEHFTRLIYATTSNTDRLLRSSKVQELLQSPQKFDLLIVDLFLSDALLGLAFYYKIPTIVVSPSGSNTWLNQRFGNAQNAALDPSNFLPYSVDMTIWQRCVNTLMAMFEKLTYSFFHMISQQAIYTKHFEPLCQLATWCKELPHHNDLTENLSLALINTHSELQYSRSFLPNMLSIAGIHLYTENKIKLPNHLMEFIEGAEKGVIYMSFGANVYEFPTEKIKIFLDVFESLSRMRFIIKYDDQKPLQMALNFTSQVMIRSWWPQQSILAHENVKLFITSGGLMSITESINYETSILAIPITPEQYVLCEKLHKKNAAFMINFNQLTYDHLSYAVNYILKNNSDDYISNLKKKLKTQLLENLDGISPMQKVLNAIELTMRTDGLKYLKPHSHHLNFWRSILLDVMLILILGLLTILMIPFLLTSCILKKAYQNQTNFKRLNKSQHRYSCKVSDVLSTTTTTSNNIKHNRFKHCEGDDFYSVERRRSSNSNILEKRKSLSSTCSNSSSCCYCTSVSSSEPTTPLPRRESLILGKD